MSHLFAIGDLHLPSTLGKSMERFGWTSHPQPLARAWDALVAPDDAAAWAATIKRLAEAAHASNERSKS